MRPRLKFHVVEADDDGVVASIEDIAAADVWINGGFFVFRRDIFDYIQPGEELVEEPFARLIERRELLAYRYDGFWEPMDTIKDKQRLDALSRAAARPGARQPRRGASLDAQALALASRREPPVRRVLAIGCHADDIEIGCGGTILALTRAHPGIEVTWVVLAAPGERAEEARASAEAFLAGAAPRTSTSTASATASSRTSAAR